VTRSGGPAWRGRAGRWEVGGMTFGTAALQAGRLELESVVRAPLVVIADPVAAASGPAVTLDELGGGGVALLDRPAGTILAIANPAAGSGLFVWASSDFLAVVADPDGDIPLEAGGDLTVPSGRLVVGAPEVVAAWGPDVDTGDGSPVRARMLRSSATASPSWRGLSPTRPPQAMTPIGGQEPLQCSRLDACSAAMGTHRFHELRLDVRISRRIGFLPGGTGG
jgi:hypothetical protein